MGLRHSRSQAVHVTCVVFFFACAETAFGAEILVDGQRAGVLTTTFDGFNIRNSSRTDLFSSFAESVEINGGFGEGKALANFSVDAEPNAVLISGSSELSATKEPESNGIESHSFLEITFTVFDEPVPFIFGATSFATGRAGLTVEVTRGTTGVAFQTVASGTIALDLVLEPGTYRLQVSSVAISGFNSPGSSTSSFTGRIGEDVCDLTWNTTNGDMGAATSWSPARVPEDSGDSCVNLLLARPGEYEVTFPSLGANSLRVENGVPILLGQVLTLSGRNNRDALSIGDGARMRLVTGTITLPQGGRMVIGAGGDSSATSELFVELSSQIQQDAQGVVDVGVTQKGLLTVSGAGSMSVGELSVGGGETGFVHVLGATSETIRAALAVARDAVIGDDSAGELLVEFGGIFGTLGNLFVGLSAPGSVTVGGEDVGGQGVQSTLTTKGTIIGGNQGTDATVTILEGGLFQTGDVRIGAGLGKGQLLLTGDNDEAMKDAKAEVSGNILVGGANDGLLRLENSALLELGRPNEGHGLRVASDGPGSGSVVLTSDDASPDLPAPMLDIEGTLDMGLTGTGAISVSRGVLSVSESMLVKRGSIALIAKDDPVIKTALLVGGPVFVVGPGDGSGTNVNVEAGARFVAQTSLLFDNGRITLSGALPDPVVDPNAPLAESASLLKVLENLTVGVSSPPDPGDARLRVQNGAVVDAGDIHIRSGEVIVSTAAGLNRPSALQSFSKVTVGNAPSAGSRIATLSVLGESFIEAPQGFLVKASGRVTHTRGAVFPKPRVESGGRIRMIRATGGKNVIPPASYQGGLTLEQGALLTIDADGDPAPHIVIEGDAELLGDLEVSFPDEAGLQTGATFNLLRINGAKNGDFNAIRFPTRSAAFRGNVRFEDGVLVLEVLNPGTPVDGRVPNDVNGDGLVNAIDVQLVVNAVLGVTLHPGFAPDVNIDQWVNAVDVQLVVNAALGV